MFLNISLIELLNANKKAHFYYYFLIQICIKYHNTHQIFFDHEHLNDHGARVDSRYNLISL